jgi:hypothetical protein
VRLSDQDLIFNFGRDNNDDDDDDDDDDDVACIILLMDIHRKRRGRMR